MKLNLLIIFLLNINLVAIDASPLITPDYPDDLDTAASRAWWETAQLAREGKLKAKHNFPDAKVVTGRHFLDLECPRDEVVAFAIYTVHKKKLKLSAQLYPLFPNETRIVRLEVNKSGKWEQIATAEVNDLGWSALFEIENWNDRESLNYRVLHGDKAKFEGLIRKNPLGKNEIVVGSLSCNSSRDKLGRAQYVHNLKAIDPDLLFFAGDQHYDHLEHTAGWIMWGIQFKEILKDRPVITIPDDHDIGQGNFWGEGGVKAETPAGVSGGYYYHHQYIKQVERCQTAHLPDAYDSRPIAQGIGVYFTNYHLGGIDFAILEDRKFKTGPKGTIPQQGPREDHILNPNYNPKEIDVPGLKLLGQRQLDFLNSWTRDWQDIEMKAVLSQSPFSGTSHIHGRPNNRLHADLDSNGWPQTARNHALKAMRKGFVVHLSGDQHLSTLYQYGIDEHNDGPWGLSSPAIVNSIYGRYWHPLDEAAGANRDPRSALPWTGEYLDGFNNKITMHAYANPDVPSAKKSRAAGFSIVKFNKSQRTITFESWDRYVDVTKQNAKPFNGWPKVIKQIDNFNPASWGKLKEFTFDHENPVIELINETTKEILYTIRVKGHRFAPHVPLNKSFTLKSGKNKPDTIIAQHLKVTGEL